MQGRLGKVERDDRMWDPTSTSRLRVTVTPRRPGFDFEGLEHEVQREVATIERHIPRTPSRQPTPRALF